MEIDDSPALGRSPTPSLPDSQNIHPLQLAAEDVERYISSLPEEGAAINCTSNPAAESESKNYSATTTTGHDDPNGSPHCTVDAIAA